MPVSGACWQCSQSFQGPVPQVHTRPLPALMHSSIHGMHTQSVSVHTGFTHKTQCQGPGHPASASMQPRSDASEHCAGATGTLWHGTTPTPCYVQRMLLAKPYKYAAHMQSNPKPPCLAAAVNGRCSCSCRISPLLLARDTPAAALLPAAQPPSLQAYCGCPRLRCCCCDYHSGTSHQGQIRWCTCPCPCRLSASRAAQREGLRWGQQQQAGRDRSV